MKVTTHQNLLISHQSSTFYYKWLGLIITIRYTSLNPQRKFMNSDALLISKTINDHFVFQTHTKLTQALSQLQAAEHSQLKHTGFVTCWPALIILCSLLEHIRHLRSQRHRWLSLLVRWTGHRYVNSPAMVSALIPPSGCTQFGRCPPCCSYCLLGGLAIGFRAYSALRVEPT